MRADPQNLPPGLAPPWPGKGYACFGGGDFSGAPSERAELYDFVRDAGVSGFTVVSGDRHSFWAGYAAKALPPAAFEPVGLAFICGSISAPGMAEAVEHGLKRHPLRPLFVSERQPGKFETTVNLTLKHGVRSALEYDRSGDLAAAHRAQQSRQCAASGIRRHGRAWLCRGHRRSEDDRERVRLHPAADRSRAPRPTAARSAIACATARRCGGPAKRRN